MSDETTQQTAVETKPKAPMMVGAQGLTVGDFDQLWRFAVIVSKSGLAPKGIQTPEAIFVAVQMGMEVGLTPMSSLQNIAVINGRPSIWGDAQLGIVRGTGQLEVFQEHYILNGKRLELPDATPRTPTPKELLDDTCAAVCVVKRRGYGISSGIFSVADAKQARLIPADPSSPWSKYPARMLKFRARSFLLRDHFGDALKGIPQAEEAMDMSAIDVEEVKPKTKRASLPPTFAPVERSTTGTETDQPAASDSPSDAVPAESGPTVVDPVEVAAKATDVPGKPAPETTAPAATSLQQGLSDVLEGAGVSFEDFRDWLGGSGKVKDATALTGWMDVPDKVCAQLQKSPKELAAVVKLYGRKEGATNV